MIEQDEVFNLFHRYNKLVRRGMTKPLQCKHCGEGLYTSLGEDDVLVLICYGCDSETLPGIGQIDGVRAVVKEHFE